MYSKSLLLIEAVKASIAKPIRNNEVRIWYNIKDKI